MFQYLHFLKVNIMNVYQIVCESVSDKISNQVHIILNTAYDSAQLVQKICDKIGRNDTKVLICVYSKYITISKTCIKKLQILLPKAITEEDKRLIFKYIRYSELSIKRDQRTLIELNKKLQLL